MGVRCEVVGANGTPPNLIVFQVSVTGRELTELLASARAQQQGSRSVPGHLAELLSILLTPPPIRLPTGTGEDQPEEGQQSQGEASLISMNASTAVNNSPPR